jgi:uncharacterized NAD(P)/FAD-binding protein YdhS
MPASLAPSAQARSIAVVGGGASGALMIAHLMRLVGDDVHLTLIDPGAEIGRGLAYATENESHRLNVRASNMSAFADDPDHFWRWLKAEGYEGEARFTFAPRALYGRYLASLIEDGLTRTGAPRVRWLRDTVAGLSPSDGAVTLRFSGGEAAAFDVAILCCGHEPSEKLEAPFVSPWEEPSSWNEAPASTILILGTGLTMVDAAISLGESGHSGRIVAVSRRGLLPQDHRRIDRMPIAEAELPSPAKLAPFLRWLRLRARDEMRRGGDWRSFFDGLRPHTQALWLAMPSEDFSNMRAPGGTRIATAWRRRSQPRSKL